MKRINFNINNYINFNPIICCYGGNKGSIFKRPFLKFFKENLL